MQTRALLASFVLAATAVATAEAQQVQFEHPKSDFVERITAGQVWVVLSAASAERVTVPFTVIGGTATRGLTPEGETDFILQNGTVSFEAGEVEKTIDLTVVDDSRTEPIETIILLLGAPSAGTLGPRSVHTYSIYDDDRLEEENPRTPDPPPGRDPVIPPPPPIPPPSVVGFVAPESSARESVAAGSMLVRRSGPARDVTVQYRVTGGTATAGDDYTLANGSLTIPAGQETASIVIAIHQDDVDEPDETVLVTLENPSVGSQLGRATSAFRIVDDDVVDVSFAQPASSVNENASPARVEVRLSGESSGAVTFLLVAGGTATGGGIDYSLAAAPVRIDAGQTSVIVPIVVVDDTAVEGSETVELAIVGPTGARLGAASRHTLTLLDNDRVLPVVRFSSASTSDAEANPPRQVEVILDAEFDEPVTVSYARTGGSASDTDYALPSGSVTFAPHETSKTITLSVVDDIEEEADETVEITLSNPVNARLAELSHHTHWILDDDAAGEDLVFYRQEILTTDDFRRLVLVGPKTRSVIVAGLAIDPNGNLYVSDQGSGSNQGSILMLPKGRRNVLRILTGLDRPADIELTPDGRGIVVSSVDGAISQKAFGLSVKLTRAGAMGPSTRVYALTDTGATRPVNVSPDGYFHLPEILTPAQLFGTVTIVVEHRGLTRTYRDVPLGSPGAPVVEGLAPAVVGHTVIQLEAPQGQ